MATATEKPVLIKREGSFDLYKLGPNEYEVRIKNRFMTEPLSLEDLTRDYPFLAEGLEHDEGEEGDL